MGLFGGGGGVCPAPEFPDNDILLPPIPTPGPDVLPKPEIVPAPPTRAELREAAEQSAADAETAIRDDLCEECLMCIALAGTMGIPPWQPYSDRPASRRGYAYQHHIVHWHHHDAANRFISEWNYAGIWFDGLDPAMGGLLATRAVSRSEYDPAQTSVCYLIDAKHGYASWFEPDGNSWKPRVPEFMIARLANELLGQVAAANTAYPSTALVWVFNSRIFKGFVDDNWVSEETPVLRTAYAPWDSNTFDIPIENSADDLFNES